MSWNCALPKDDTTCDNFPLSYASYRSKKGSGSFKAGSDPAKEMAALRSAHAKEIESLNNALNMQKAVMSRDLHSAEVARISASQRAGDLENEVRRLNTALSSKVSPIGSDKTALLTQSNGESPNTKTQELTKEIERLRSELAGKCLANAHPIKSPQRSPEVSINKTTAPTVSTEEIEKLRSELIAAQRISETAVNTIKELTEENGLLKRNIKVEEEKLKNEEEKLKNEILKLKNVHANEIQSAKDAVTSAKQRVEMLESALCEERSVKTQLQESLEEMKESNLIQLKSIQELQERHQHLQEELELERDLITYNKRLFEDLGREQAIRKKLHNDMEELKGKIRVYVRVRPLSSTETETRCKDCIFQEGACAVQIRGVGFPESLKTYEFDKVYCGRDEFGQEEVFKDTKNMVLSVIDAYNVCIFAYGQTGSGKTYTMIGGADIAESVQPDGTFDLSAGILPRAVMELFRLLEERSAQMTATVEVQMLQLYKDKLEDMLGASATGSAKVRRRGSGKEEPTVNLKIVLAEHSPSGLVEVEGSEKIIATSASEVMQIVASGSSRRSTASTQMNAESSRSHLICVLVVKMENRRTKAVTVGKLTMVDLAGSERVSKSGATGEVMKEAQSINKSLSALGGVINAVSTGNNHIPYRDHALTMLMSDSIGGNAKTLMFVNCSPADYNNVESNNSLTFAARCKDIANSISTIVPGGGQQAVISALKREIVRLKRNEKEDNRNGKRTERQNSDSDVMSIS